MDIRTWWNDQATITAPSLDLLTVYTVISEVITAILTQQKILELLRSQRRGVARPLLYLAMLVVVTVVVKSLEIRVLPAVSVDTAEVWRTISVLLTVCQLLLSDTDTQEDLPPGVVTVTVPVFSVSSLALSQRGALGISLTRSELSLLIISPGKAHVHEATVIQASFAPDVLTIIILSTYRILRDVSENSESLIRRDALVERRNKLK